MVFLKPKGLLGYSHKKWMGWFFFQKYGWKTSRNEKNKFFMKNIQTVFVWKKGRGLKPSAANTSKKKKNTGLTIVKYNHATTTRPRFALYFSQYVEAVAIICIRKILWITAKSPGACSHPYRIIYNNFQQQVQVFFT